jgi:hypothetical protein
MGIFVTPEGFVLRYGSPKIIGIAETSTGVWARIDADGNNLTASEYSLGGLYYDDHPVYAGITHAAIDGQAMGKIPKFYYKYGLGPAGSDQAGKKCRWISDLPTDGFSVFPAFAYAGGELDHAWISDYQATNDGGTKAGSIVNTLPLVSIDFPTMRTRCSARNTGGQTGWQMWDIWQLSALKLLCLIEMGGSNSQSIIGAGNVSSSAAVVSGSTNATWRGFYELWGNVWQMVDGLKFSTAGVISTWDMLGNQTYVNTGVIQTPDMDGYPVTVFDDTGNDFDLSSLFIGKTVTATAANSAFFDYMYANDPAEENVTYHGGYWPSGSNAGLFYFFLSNVASNASSNIGARLAKRDL